MSAFSKQIAQGLVLPYHMNMAMSCSYSRYDTPLGVLLVAADADGITDLAIGARRVVSGNCREVRRRARLLHGRFPSQGRP
jgi:hypothetical protein